MILPKNKKKPVTTKQKMKDPDYIDDNMLLGRYHGEYLGLTLDNMKANRSANVLVIGGTGTGKTFKYIKPNILQENASMIITDPSGDIFSSFAPYLLSRGYNVYLFNASDFTLSCHFNPLLNVYDSNGEISETQVDILVDLYMKNAKAGKEAGGSDPFWDKSEKAFMTALIYYVLESDEFGTTRPQWNVDLKWGEYMNKPEGSEDAWSKNGEKDGEQWDKCFSTVLKLAQQAKVEDDSGSNESNLTIRMNKFFERMDAKGTPYKCKAYYNTFLIAPQKTANTILITTAVDLQIFSTALVDYITREDYEHPEMNIDIDKIATQQSYLFLGIPQSHQAYNFLIAMLYSQLYGRLYDLGERKLRGKWHIGYRMGTPVFEYFNSREEAVDFYENVRNDRLARKRIEDTFKKAAIEQSIYIIEKEKASFEDKVRATAKSSIIAEKSGGKKNAKNIEVTDEEIKERYSEFKSKVLSDLCNKGWEKFIEPKELEKQTNEFIKENGLGSNITTNEHINGTKIYRIEYNGIRKSSVLKEPLEKMIDDIDAGKMVIWCGDDYARGTPALPIHVNFLLDEFKNIGEIPNFLTILSTSRKYRIGSHVVVQDIGQLKTMYKDGEHETVMANVDTTIFLGSILNEDKEAIQKILGKTTILQRSVSTSKTGTSTSWTPTQVDLMSIDKIAAINQHGRDDEIVIVRDCTPFVCNKLNLSKHRRFKLTKSKKVKAIKIEDFYRNSMKNAYENKADRSKLKELDEE